MGSSTLISQPVLEKENLEIKFFKLRLKIDLVSHPVCAEDLGNIYKDLEMRFGKKKAPKKN